MFGHPEILVAVLAFVLTPIEILLIVGALFSNGLLHLLDLGQDNGESMSGAETSGHTRKACGVAVSSGSPEKELGLETDFGGRSKPG